jgi:hypothetical protein
LKSLSGNRTIGLNKEIGYSLQYQRIVSLNTPTRSMLPTEWII